MQEQSDKIEKNEKRFIPDEKPKEKKEIVTEKDIEEKIDMNFDENSLAVYGALLSEQLDKGEPGKEVATPQAMVGEIISEERIKRKKELKEKAEKLL